MARPKTLIIDGKTVKEIVTMAEAVREVEKYFKLFGRGKAQMPPKVYITLDKYNGDFRSMPTYVEDVEVCGIKWVNVHPDNRKKGIPTVMGIIIYSDPRTGFPLAIMDATYATALRTGAAGGVAAKYLARKSSKIVALVGCGVQARTQLAALNEVAKISVVNVFGKTHSETLKFKRWCRRTFSFEVKIIPSIEGCVKEADIIVTTTPARKPVIKCEWLKKRVHINAIGADAAGKEELDVKILKGAKIVVDAWVQAAHSGEINVPVKKKQITKRDIYADIGEVTSGKKKGRVKKDNITVFDSTGLAVQDMAIASLIYKKAKKLNKGKNIQLFN